MPGTPVRTDRTFTVPGVGLKSTEFFPSGFNFTNFNCVVCVCVCVWSCTCEYVLLEVRVMEAKVRDSLRAGVTGSF